MTDDRRTPGEPDGEVVSPRVPGWTPRQVLPGELSVGPRIDDLGSLPEPVPAA
jgi:hypothetical protein